MSSRANPLRAALLVACREIHATCWKGSQQVFYAEATPIEGFPYKISGRMVRQRGNFKYAYKLHYYCDHLDGRAFVGGHTHMSTFVNILLSALTRRQANDVH